MSELFRNPYRQFTAKNLMMDAAVFPPSFFFRIAENSPLRIDVFGLLT